MNFTQKLRRLIHKPDYFFIIGPGRGGTSLLASMLDFHPHLQVGFERFAYDYLLGNKLNPNEQTNIEIRLSCFEKACAEVASMNHLKWGNKITTEQIASLHKCEGVVAWGEVDLFLKKVIQNRKVLFVVRDGRHCVLSKINRTPQNYKEAVSRWKYAVQVLEHLKKAGVNLHLCRYEDVVQNPEVELKKICDFLQIPYDDQVLNGPANPKMPNMYAGKALKPLKPLTEEQLQWTDDMGVELKLLGYINEDDN